MAFVIATPHNGIHGPIASQEEADNLLDRLRKQAPDIDAQVAELHDPKELVAWLDADRDGD